MSSEQIIPEPLSANDKSSFAYRIVKNHLPVILGKVIDFINRERDGIHRVLFFLCHKNLDLQILEELQEDYKLIADNIATLREELENNKSAELFETLPLAEEFNHFNKDVKDWNNGLESNKLEDGSLPRWFDSAWLLVECYMHRRIKDFCLRSRHLQLFDPFVEIKQQAITGSLKHMQSIGDKLIITEKVILESECHTHPSERTEFTTFVQLSLWANKSDLSFSLLNPENMHKGQANKTIKDYIEDLHEFILCDHLSEAWSRFQDIKLKAINLASKVKTGSKSEELIYIDLVADNSGYELFVDLCLAHFITLMLVGDNDKSVLKFRLHFKTIPWFVSDCMPQDFERLLDFMRKSNSGTNLNTLAQKWSLFVKNKTWDIKQHHFYTLPHDYSHMSSLSPDLFKELQQSSFIIFKGDLNYRKLVGDLKWSITTPFKNALRGFGPAPLMALRTSKANVVVGIEDAQLKARINNNELPHDWMTSGNFALIQCQFP